LEHAVVCSKGSVIEVGALPRSILRPAAVLPPRGRPDTAAQTLDVLASHRGNQSAAARTLGINRTTLWRRLKKIESSNRLRQ
jgi:transcriptional regulator of acetoin/glycerol metabolism